jgi:hypothetical protein
MPEFEHNEELSMPKNISKYGVCTGHIFLLNMLLAYSKSQFMVAFVLGTLYITTILHWREPYKKGWIRKLDVTMVWTTFVVLSYYICFYINPAYHTHCFCHFCIVIFVNYVNETLDYYQINEKVYLPEIKEKEEDQVNVRYHPFHSFSLRYTYPNTMERENAYKRSVFIHCAFVHLWMAISIMYFVYYHSLPTTGITSAKEFA